MWPSSVSTASPVAASHTLTVLSQLPDATRAPSGLKATALTAAASRSRGRPPAPDAGAQRLSGLSQLTDAARAPRLAGR